MLNGWVGCVCGAYYSIEFQFNSYVTILWWMTKIHAVNRSLYLLTGWEAKWCKILMFHIWAKNKSIYPTLSILFSLFFVLQHLNSQITYTNISLKAITMPQHVRYNTYNGNVISEMYCYCVARPSHCRSTKCYTKMDMCAAKMCFPKKELFLMEIYTFHFTAFNTFISRDVNMCDKLLHIHMCVCLCVCVNPRIAPKMSERVLSCYYCAQNESLCRALLMPHYNNLAQLCYMHLQSKYQHIQWQRRRQQQ